MMMDLTKSPYEILKVIIDHVMTPNSSVLRVFHSRLKDVLKTRLETILCREIPEDEMDNYGYNFVNYDSRIKGPMMIMIISVKNPAIEELLELSFNTFYTETNDYVMTFAIPEDIGITKMSVVEIMDVLFRHFAVIIRELFPEPSSQLECNINIAMVYTALLYVLHQSANLKTFSDEDLYGKILSPRILVNNRFSLNKYLSEEDSEKVFWKINKYDCALDTEYIVHDLLPLFKSNLNVLQTGKIANMYVELFMKMIDGFEIPSVEEEVIHDEDNITE